MPVDQARASTLIHNARIYCFDNKDTIADALLIEVLAGL